MTIAAVLVLVAVVLPLPAPARIGAVAIGLGRVMGAVPVLLAGAVAAGTVAARRLADRARQRERDAAAELLAVDLIALGVSGGLSLPQAVEVAASTVAGEPHRRLRALQRRFAAGATAPVGDGPFAEVVRLAERSAASGASLGPGLRAVAESLRSERAAADRARLARLPVRLLFPLALLILPGFILLAVGPAVLSGLSRLSL